MRELEGAGRSSTECRPVAGTPAALTTLRLRRRLGCWVACGLGRVPSRSQEQARDPVQEQGREPGQAPTVLLLNGCGLGAASWQKVVAGLPGYRMIAVDRPAYQGGGSAPPPSLPGLTRLVSRLLQEVAAGPVVVVAHSMAAFQAEALARLHPEQVVGVVLVDPSMLSRRSWLRPLGRRALHRTSSLVGLALRCPPLQVVAAGAWRAVLRRQTRDPQAVAVEPWVGSWAGPETLTDAAAQWLSYGGQAEALRRLRARQDRPCQVPAVVLEAPPVPTPQQVVVLESAFKTLRRRRVPGSRHLLMLDAPQVVVAEVKRLLQEAS
ncbi:alpha/beta fold hydrolase [Actinomyces trachealis]|uniref:alpha/beta fold hydrolase n=1 Tax=Actinomyces trachealis TaxID=2763540 RepID=UPI0018C512E4|nr:alpha/beta hydrolase [Actinomyces trachealis]